jgi:hypothetical protein
MFVVSEEAAAAIRAAFDQGGELSAAVELRRLFPGIADNAKARECARTVALSACGAGRTLLPVITGDADGSSSGQDCRAQHR